MADFLHIHSTVDLQDLLYRTIEVDIQDFPTFTIDEIDLWELIKLPHACMKLVEGQILEEFMLEEDIDFQERDNCKNVELQSKQEICVEMKTCDMSLPELFKAKESVHTNEIVSHTHRTSQVKSTH